MVGWQGTGNVAGEERSRNLDGKSAFGKCQRGKKLDYTSGLKAIKHACSLLSLTSYVTR